MTTTPGTGCTCGDDSHHGSKEHHKGVPDTMLASERVLRKDWDSPEEDDAWKELDMPDIPNGEPCAHPGCLNHVTHPCDGCGRIAGDHL